MHIFEFIIAFTGILIVICNLFWLTAKSAVLISDGLCTRIKRWKWLIWWLFIFHCRCKFSFLHWSNTSIQPANNYNIHTAILSLPCLCYCLKLKNDIYININTYIFFSLWKMRVVAILMWNHFCLYSIWPNFVAPYCKYMQQLVFLIHLFILFLGRSFFCVERRSYLACTVFIWSELITHNKEMCILIQLWTSDI